MSSTTTPADVRAQGGADLGAIRQCVTDRMAEISGDCTTYEDAFHKLEIANAALKFVRDELSGQNAAWRCHVPAAALTTLPPTSAAPGSGGREEHIRFRLAEIRGEFARALNCGPPSRETWRAWLDEALNLADDLLAIADAQDRDAEHRAGELDAARALLPPTPAAAGAPNGDREARLAAELQRLADECQECSGTGEDVRQHREGGRTFEIRTPCPRCTPARALLAEGAQGAGGAPPLPKFDWREPSDFTAGLLRCAMAGKATPEQLAEYLDADSAQIGEMLLRFRAVLLELNKPLCTCNGMGKCAICQGRALISDMDAAAVEGSDDE